MAVVVSPANNTGWGLGLRRLYGGAKHKSAQHPVFVHSHYRAGWGTVNRRRAPVQVDEGPSRPKSKKSKRKKRVQVTVETASAPQVDETIQEVAENGPTAARVAIAAARNAGRYNLRRRRRLTRLGQALAQRVLLMRTRAGRRVRVKRRK